MKVKIFGAGMSGCFLANKLESFDIDYEIYDIRKIPNCECAWGLVLTKYMKKEGIFDNYFKDYILVKPRKMIVNGISRNINYVYIFDKKKWLSDMWNDLDVERISKPDLSGCDVVVDATGWKRDILGRCDNDNIMITYQFIYETDCLNQEYIYIYANKLGYAWAFPLCDNKWHIGSGSYSEEETVKLLQQLIEEYGIIGERRCFCESKIRCVPFGSMPIYRDNVVGVGESIGLVSLLGEGNTPAIESSDILANYLTVINEFNMEPDNVFIKYKKELEKFFSWQPKQYEFYRVYTKSKVRAIPKFFKYVIDYRKRIGDYCSFVDLLKMIYLYFKI